MTPQATELAQTTHLSSIRPVDLGHARHTSVAVGVLALAAICTALVATLTGAPAAAALIAITGATACGGIVALEAARQERSSCGTAPPRTVDIEAPALREAFESTLRKLSKLAYTVPPNHSLVGRCRDIVYQAGHGAVRTNRLYEYLRCEPAVDIEQCSERLEELSAVSKDPQACELFARAAFAKLQQLETRDEIRGVLDRAHARLQLVAAALDLLRAKLIKLDAVSAEDAAQIVTDANSGLDALELEIHLLEDDDSATP